jgi:hypothetical protein
MSSRIPGHKTSQYDSDRDTWQIQARRRWTVTVQDLRQFESCTEVLHPALWDWACW